MHRAPEIALLVLLAVLGVATLLLLVLDVDLETAVDGARAVCVGLAVLLVGGLIIPWRRHLARKRDAERNRS